MECAPKRKGKFSVRWLFRSNFNEQSLNWILCKHVSVIIHSWFILYWMYRHVRCHYLLSIYSTVSGQMVLFVILFDLIFSYLVPPCQKGFAAPKHLPRTLSVIATTWVGEEEGQRGGDERDDPIKRLTEMQRQSRYTPCTCYVTAPDTICLATDFFVSWTRCHVRVFTSPFMTAYSA